MCDRTIFIEDEEFQTWSEADTYVVKYNHEDNSFEQEQIDSG